MRSVCRPGVESRLCRLLTPHIPELQFPFLENGASSLLLAGCAWESAWHMTGNYQNGRKHGLSSVHVPGLVASSGNVVGNKRNMHGPRFLRACVLAGGQET